MTIIAFSGKGGTGKTTLAALTVKYFIEKDEVTLAFDMDPDAHLYKRLVHTTSKNNRPCGGSYSQGEKARVGTQKTS